MVAPAPRHAIQQLYTLFFRILRSTFYSGSARRRQTDTKCHQMSHCRVGCASRRRVQRSVCGSHRRTSGQAPPCAGCTRRLCTFEYTRGLQCFPVVVPSCVLYGRVHAQTIIQKPPLLFSCTVVCTALPRKVRLYEDCARGEPRPSSANRMYNIDVRDSPFTLSFFSNGTLTPH